MIGNAFIIHLHCTLWVVNTLFFLYFLSTIMCSSLLSILLLYCCDRIFSLLLLLDSDEDERIIRMNDKK